jgi:hypothetical protein
MKVPWVNKDAGSDPCQLVNLDGRALLVVEPIQVHLGLGVGSADLTGALGRSERPAARPGRRGLR